MAQARKVELTEEQRAWLQAGPVLPETFILKSSRGTATYRILDRTSEGRVTDIGARMGFKGFVLKVEDVDTEAVYAAKLCISDDYSDERNEFIETRLANKLREADSLFVIPERVGRVVRFNDMPGPQEDFVCFISGWVNGETLQHRCESHTKALDPEFICTVILEILRAIRFLASRNLKHDDLHWGNVMLKTRDPHLALTAHDRAELRVSIIDMGSLKPYEQATSKSRNDFLCLLEIMVNLYNIAWTHRQIPASNPFFISGFRKLIEQMADEDHLRYFPREESLPEAIIELRESLRRPQFPEFNRPFQPFEAISAEHLADDVTLMSLFEGSLPWFMPVLESKPIVLTGPRGCGKSMLFRYMAARTHLASASKRIESEPALSFFGIYVSCASHLQNNLVWIARKPGRARDLAESIATFFQLVVMRELLRALAVAYQSESARAKYCLTESGFDELISYIERFFEQSVETPRLTSKLRILHFADDLDRLRVSLHLDLLNQRQPKTLLPDTFLSDVASQLRVFLPCFARIPVVFLLDDYSSNRVHPDIQSILNRIIFERRDSHYFKVSCEKFGFIPNDIDGVRIDPSREYEEIDAGSYATADLPEATSRKFLAGLIDRRLELAKWQGRTESLIGSSRREFKDDAALAKYIREKGSTQGKHYYYFGIEHLARLWSGDIATILQIVKEMFVLGAIDKDRTEVIPKHLQHQAIVSVSRAFKERINGYHPYGPEMATILNNFGGMARDILVTGELDSANHPRRLYRLEMSKREPEHILSLLERSNPGAALLAKELLRRAIFIQLADSRGKEGPSTQTVRWEIRKIFLPAFGVSLERNHYIDVKCLDDFLHLLTDSQSFCAKVRAKYALGKNQDRLTGSLFSDEQ